MKWLEFPMAARTGLGACVPEKLKSLWPLCTQQVSEWHPAAPGGGTKVGCGEGCWGVMLNPAATQEQPLNQKGILETGCQKLA